MNLNAKNAAKSNGPLPYRTKRDHINTPRIRHTNPSKMVLMREEKKKRAAEIRAQSMRLKEERVRTETRIREDQIRKIKTQRDKRGAKRGTKHYPRLMEPIVEVNLLVQPCYDLPEVFAEVTTEMEPPTAEAIVEPIMKVSSFIQPCCNLPEVVAEDIIRHFTEVVTELEPSTADATVEPIIVTDELVMEVITYINSVAMDQLVTITNVTMAELAAMEIAEMISTTLSNFYPTTLDELAKMQIQVVMWIEMIINQARTVEMVGEINIIETEAETMIATITEIETEVSQTEVDVITLIKAHKLTLADVFGLISMEVEIESILLMYGRVDPVMPFRWCKRTRLKHK